MMPRYLSVAVALILSACADGQTVAPSNIENAISSGDSLSQTALTPQDYRDFLAAREAEELKHLYGKTDVQQELVLDYHSNRVLADHAKSLGLENDPLTRERLARASRQILISALIDKITREMEYPEDSVLEDLAHEHYLKNQDAYKRDESRRVAHILLKDQFDCPCEVKPLGERIEEIYQRLEAGEEFADLAARYSADRANAENGGELSKPVVEGGVYLPSFTDAAFNLQQVGDVSKPLHTGYGTHLIKLLEVTPGRTIPYEEVRDELFARKRKELLESKIAALRSNAYPKLDSLDLDKLNAVIGELVQAASAE